MKTYKQAELRNAVLAEIGVLDGQSTQGNPSPEDASTADQACEQELAYLFGEGLIPFGPDSEAIPATFFRALVWFIAPSLIPAFGVLSRAAYLEANKTQAMRRLSVLREARTVGSVAQAEYF